MKTSELTGADLNEAVARCLGDEPIKSGGTGLSYSSDWLVAGPIIEREGISLFRHEAPPVLNCGKYYWKANNTRGPTALIAAMRCYVASKLGDEVVIPEETI